MNKDRLVEPTYLDPNVGTLEGVFPQLTQDFLSSFIPFSVPRYMGLLSAHIRHDCLQRTRVTKEEQIK